jgi:pimeloyl-ACP methyl ester carboxylesterase
MNYHLVLVHGTGARGAEWTRPESALCRHLTRAFPDQVSFSSPEWTGRNTFQARVDGAKKLREEVQKATRDGRVPILVGHSHGGSLIAHALAREGALCREVGGVVFLATPFIHARQLPLGRHLPKGPALLAGLLCAIAVFVAGLWVIASAGWPGNGSRVLSTLAIGLVYLGLFIWWVTFREVGRFLGVSNGLITKRTTEKLAALVGQLDLGELESRGLNKRALLIRSTADEAASGLAAVQLLGRIASDLPSLTWKLPRSVWEWFCRRAGLDGPEPPGWVARSFGLVVLLAAAGFSIRGAAWLSEWPALRLIDAQLRDVSSSAVRTVFTAFVWMANGVVLLLLATVPLIAIGIPLKLLGLLLYGLRGWPVLQALYIELSVEPAPPGEWRVHQLDAKSYGAQEENTWAHSLVYDDPRAHRAIEEWLKNLA